MPIAHRIQSTAPLDDAFAQAFATRNEQECDRSTPIGWLALVALFAFLLIAAGVKGLVVFALIVAALGVFWLFASAAEEARKDGAIR